MYGQGKTRGQVGILGIEATTNQACAVIPPSDKINSIFLFEQLKHRYDDLRSLARGGNQANLNCGLIKNYQVIYPPISLQNHFTSIVTQIEKQKAQTQLELNRAEELYQSLLQRAFTGELFPEPKQKELTEA
jgi:type I restriction enzyme S subunit